MVKFENISVTRATVQAECARRVGSLPVTVLAVCLISVTVHHVVRKFRPKRYHYERPNALQACIETIFRGFSTTIEIWRLLAATRILQCRIHIEFTDEFHKQRKGLKRSILIRKQVCRGSKYVKGVVTSRTSHEGSRRVARVVTVVAQHTLQLVFSPFETGLPYVIHIQVLTVKRSATFVSPNLYI